MSGGWAVEVSGFKELEAQLRKLPEDLQREALEDAVRDGAAVVRYEAMRLVPVRTGKLKRSLTIRVTKQRNTGGDPRGEVGPSKQEQHIGRFQEFGTAHHAAQPFLRPAIETRAQEVIQLMGDVIRNFLAKLDRGHVAG